uniref:Cystathionine gamma-lyase n=1 Tax=Chromera velia CCMP2878 TaxID=1169474 RepID=A0A0G4HPC6_9ALVE|eukprot:Cvel_7749.t1-p1 / transcript=Cvel_7749.t1 / gene=Cvel_7749 / organism=Chromera_velia_CCMP2878 / gene_product=Cystathionine beta-lyase, putative / transcript_product=Cystathionine beta-lyase, putative / location=Cvel_scaffold412:72273-73544(+) / protein_length=424 / sequence_SO=supercontig / SO=protein_coding / is_pseudo=false
MATASKGHKDSRGPESKADMSMHSLAVHAGDTIDKVHRAIVPPITCATSFVVDGLGDGEKGEFAYSRVKNPTRLAYETALADLEGGVYAAATSSGVAAASLAIDLLPSGSHVLVMRGVYGGTHRLFQGVKAVSNGIEFEYIDMTDTETLRGRLRDTTRMVWVETPTNPLLELVDIRKVVETVKRTREDRNGCGGGRTVLVAVDNTFASCFNQKPLDMGADLVMLSTSKYIGGHSDLIGGALVVRDRELAERVNFLSKSVGAIASPFDCFLALRGVKTLALRMERQCANALRVAQFLEGQEKVRDVRYPGLPSHKQHDVCRAQMRTGGAVVTIRLKENTAEMEGESEFSLDSVRRFVSPMRFFVLAESLGGVESMINHSATMSHGGMSREERESVGVFDSTLRLSIGIEDEADLTEDLRRGLAAL